VPRPGVVFHCANDWRQLVTLAGETVEPGRLSAFSLGQRARSLFFQAAGAMPDVFVPAAMLLFAVGIAEAYVSRAIHLYIWLCVRITV
jgi:hypothetical protein